MLRLPNRRKRAKSQQMAHGEDQLAEAKGVECTLKVKEI